MEALEPAGDTLGGELAASCEPSGACEVAWLSGDLLLFLDLDARDDWIRSGDT